MKGIYIAYTILNGGETTSLIDVILTRRSIRKYEDREIPGEVMNKILEAGRQAPSAMNRQPWHFIVVTDSEIKERLSRGRWNRFIREAPVTLVGCAYIGDPYARKWSAIDTTIAMENMVIAAWAMGVGSCWIGDFREDEVKGLLGIPDDWRVVALLTFGYPAEKPRARWRKPLEEIVSYNRF